MSVEDLAGDKSADEAVRSQTSWLLDTNFDTNNKFKNGRVMALFNHEWVQKGLRELEKLLAVSFERAQQSGAIRTEVAAAKLARTLLSTLRNPLNEVDRRSGALQMEQLKAEICRLLLGA